MNTRINFVAILFLFAAVGCSSEGFDGEPTEALGGSDFNNQNNSNGGNRPLPPVVEREFEFARPATVGQRLFVANETLNTVAVIDAVSLAIETLPVGFRPTGVVGPRAELVEDTRIFVLNQGSSTVSVVEPDTLQTTTYKVMRYANAIASNPTSTVAVTWFDGTKAREVPPDVDISAVSVITQDFEAQIAVGFNVRRVEFSEDGAYVIILTDDGISRLEVALIQGDTFAPPIPIGAEGFSSAQNAEVLIDPSGRYVISRVAGFPGLILLDLETGEGKMVGLPSRPTDEDWVRRADLAIMVTLPEDDMVVVATVPDGLLNLVGAFGPETSIEVDMGASDMSDMGADLSDMSPADMGDIPDMGGDAGDDTGVLDMASDMDDTVDLPEIDGVEFIVLEVSGLGLSEVAPDGTTALIFEGTRRGREAVIIQALGTSNDTRTVVFEKPVRAAKADPAGETFVVIHTKEAGDPPIGTGPADPEFIARSWALTLLDVKSGFGQLLLTEFQTNELAIYSDATHRVLYVTFAGLGSRNVLVANLGTFSTSSFTVASPTDGLGPIEGQLMIYVSQEHPQGRLSFVDVETQKRRTVTGYELNAGID